MVIRRHLRAGCFTGAIILLTLSASTASAQLTCATPDTCTSELSETNTSGFTGPFGLVTIDLTSSTTAHITFTSQTGASGTTYYFVDTNAADVNVNASNWTIGSFSVTAAPGATTATLSDGGSGNVDGFGIFNQTTVASDGTGSASSELDFTLTNTSGVWDSASQVLTQNSNGDDAAAHVTPCTGTDVSTCAGTSTQFVAEFTVPEPASIVLLGTGILGACALRRRRMRPKRS